MTMGASSAADGRWVADVDQLVHIIGVAVPAVVRDLIDADNLERLARMRQAMEGIEGGRFIVDSIHAANYSLVAVHSVAECIRVTNPGSSLHADFADRLRAEAAWLRYSLLVKAACSGNEAPMDEAAMEELMREMMLRFGDDYKAAGDKLTEALLVEPFIDDDRL